ncbi:PREDICTED: ER membrane protein complex subunit 10-like isoform X1 [Camelina sativa]|uniref:ER membrane protein complex subunit 10 n=1 Tax=Camelina sativa TaxID=90675 RepID=A0ABM0Y6A6_CAMSA|nr:PREDICTED: ER membrane protein complex subunit 10-like isoform X1 [Camelina sativa]XP_010496206.1 PREDICTED: ER membrane protein complex subunit 10-like isoform X1 [Camelina sativa]XP_010496207.1 PREDICTED: ER membrane protein complex subunit 10-like isoform X1 [Camelina sativa]
MAKLTLVFFLSFLIFSSSIAFQSDELLVDDDEFGLEGAKPRSTDLYTSSSSSSPQQQQQTPTIRRRYSDPTDLDSKVQFTLEHAFGDSDFSPAGTFSARLKTWSHGGKTLTKLRFSRNDFSAEEKDAFKNLLKGDDFYRIRLPSNVVSPRGREFVVASVRARCLPRDGLDEHFIIHMEGANILAVSYGSPGACQYPRQFKLPAKWSFNSHTILKSSEQAPRTPIFTEEILGSENAEGEVEPPPERSFWAKYWMYLIPLGLVVMNAVTQASNMAEEPTGGQAGGAQVQQPARRR